eukprot:CAMPEP_0171044238 /NCGR_PEP_ID=MMETSP0736-20130129/47597_1 /TAXON_ID=186038 /ORGANISM="Fragilariopsis kerguelensis, Strain L26-C5" /LENGTH=36 /DNA_ID= /DNA_START= /DNA_END= /DNA_ORIENTATION=
MDGIANQHPHANLAQVAERFPSRVPVPYHKSNRIMP